MTDETIKRGPRRPPRNVAPTGESDMRQDRAMSDRGVTENREISDDIRIAEFEAKFMEAVLPSLPEIPGFHTFWASTTHQQQTIPSMIRLGYQFVKSSDIPGWNLVGSVATGEYAGCIGQKEMIAMKLPLNLYQAYMEINHHKRPLSEEEKLKYTVAQHNETARTKGGAVLGVGEGFDQFGQRRETPDFVDPTWRPQHNYLGV